MDKITYYNGMIHIVYDPPKKVVPVKKKEEEK